MTITLRLIESDDLETLHKWLNRKHLFPFYMQEPVSLGEVLEKFNPRVGGNHKTKCLFASYNETPFGYVQWYLNRSYPAYGAATIGKHNGFSIDYFIGETEYLGKGLGSSMLKNIVRQVFPLQELNDRIAFIGHDNKNTKAIRCTLYAGFIEEKSFTDKGKKSTLFNYKERNQNS